MQKDAALSIFGLVTPLAFFVWLGWQIYTPSAKDEARYREHSERRSESCNRYLMHSGHPEAKTIQLVLTSQTASPKEKYEALNYACVEDGGLSYVFETFGQPDSAAVEKTIRRAHAEAEIANRQVDQAMEDIIGDYRKRAKSVRTSATAAARVDMFEMPDGSTVICGTTFKNGARVTDCN